MMSSDYVLKHLPNLTNGQLYEAQRQYTQHLIRFKELLHAQPDNGFVQKRWEMSGDILSYTLASINEEVNRRGD